MIVVLGFCQKDFQQAANLLQWCSELEPQIHNHELVLMSSKEMNENSRKLVIRSAKSAFKNVSCLCPKESDERGWPMSPNALWRTACSAMESRKSSWYWIEPDCVPLKPGWLDSISREYAGCGKLCWGVLYDRPWLHLTGCAIYPPNYRTINKEAVSGIKQPNAAWDMIDPEKSIPHTFSSKLFHHEWGNCKYNIAPSFPNFGSLRLINSEAVIFHRCKDGTLISRLREFRQMPEMALKLKHNQPQTNVFDLFEDSVP